MVLKGVCVYRRTVFAFAGGLSRAPLQILVGCNFLFKFNSFRKGLKIASFLLRDLVLSCCSWLSWLRQSGSSDYFPIHACHQPNVDALSCAMGRLSNDDDSGKEITMLIMVENSVDTDAVFMMVVLMLDKNVGDSHGTSSVVELPRPSCPLMLLFIYIYTFTV